MDYLKKQSNSINNVTMKLLQKRKNFRKMTKKHTISAGTKIRKMLEMIQSNDKKRQQKD